MRAHVERFLRWGAVALALTTSACLVPAPNSGQVVPGPQPSLTTPTGHQNRPYGPAGVANQLDVFEPPGTPTGLRPLIVYVHGGAWVFGSKDDLRCGGTPPCNPASSLPALGMQLNRGYVVASINYRLLTTAGANPHPAQVTDVKLAIKWLRDNAATYHIDPNQVVLAGHSAGGHLAALAALTPGHWEPAGVAATHVDGFMVLNGPTDLETWAEWGDEPGQGRAAFIADNTELLVGCDYTEDGPGGCAAPGGAYDMASPLHHASASSPPAYLTCKDWDPFVPCDQLEALHDKLVTLQSDDVAAVLDRIACTGSRPVPCGNETQDVEKHNPDWDLNLAAMQQWLDAVTN